MVEPISISVLTGGIGFAIAMIITKLIKDERFTCNSNCQWSIKRIMSKRFKKEE